MRRCYVLVAIVILSLISLIGWALVADQPALYWEAWTVTGWRQSVDDVMSVLLQPLVTTLPMVVIIWAVGRGRVVWRRFELTACFIPWFVSLVFVALFRDERYLGYGVAPAVLGGLVLLPRLLIAIYRHTQADQHSVALTLIATTLLSLLLIGQAGPLWW